MAGKYIIDGFNLGYKVPQIAAKLKQNNLSSAIQAIILAVQTRLTEKVKQVIIVFDGQPFIQQQFNHSAHIKILFSRAPQKADDIIREFIRKTAEVRQCVVVTSDHEILNTAHDMGARTLTSSDFLATFPARGNRKQSAATEKKYNPQQIDMDYWLKIFGENE